MKVQLVTKGQTTRGVEVLGVYEGLGEVSKDKVVSKFLKDTPKFGKTNEAQLLYSGDQTYLLVGLGKQDKLDFETLQNWAGTAAKSLLNKTKEATLVLPETEIPAGDLVESVVLGIQIAEFNLASVYKSESEPQTLKNVFLSLDRSSRDHSEGLNRGNIEAESINLARRLGDLPPNEMTPTYFLSEAKKIAKEGKLKITILDEKQAKKKGMGAFTAVAAGSDEPAYLIALEYLGDNRSKEKWGLVGKGVTFDTGGISIKPGNGMHEMKYDMCGAGSVLGTMKAISQIKPKVNVVGIMVLSENTLSGKAFKPGDILKSYSGKTAEVLNTDAEGRLLLLDGVAWAQKDFKATKLVDLATLTGAMIVALGDHYTGVFANNDKFASDLIEAGKKVGERYWQLPMDNIFDEMIKSDLADITNLGHGGSMPGAAGSITGAKFIEAGVENNTPWIHLDIAGTAWDMKPKSFRSAGATGVGIKTLVKLLS